MGNAFGISVDDVLIVAKNHGVSITEEQAQDWFDELDHDAVEGAALYENDLDAQTDLAHEEIFLQLVRLGHIKPDVSARAKVKP